MNTINLTDLYRNQAHEYRVALEREIWHTKRIFGEPLPDNVRRVLLTSLKEIQIPTINTSQYDSKTLLTVPKPNFHLIMRTVVANI